MQNTLKKELFDWFNTIAISLIIVFIIKFFIFDVIAIDGASMQPTLHDKDRVFVSIIGYKLSQPKNQDVIIFTPSIDPKHYYIKRIIGVPGDTVEIKGGKVFVNSTQLNETYLKPDTFTQAGSYLQRSDKFNIIVPKDTVFVMGDNRGGSEDSRDPLLGPIPIKSIKGHAIFRIFPFNNTKKL